MPVVKWNRREFRVSGQPVTRALFDAWVADGAGKLELRQEYRATSARWCFGHLRARHRLYRAARVAFTPRGTFALALNRTLDGLPAVIRACALVIRRSGYRHLFTFDSRMAVAAAPRAIVREDFVAVLRRELIDLPQVQRFRGLVEQVISVAAAEAEALMFASAERGAMMVDSTGTGLILDVDRGFRWRLGLDGHYYYAYLLDEKADLNDRKERRRFIGDARELLKVQRVHMARLQGADLSEVIEALRARRLVRGARAHAARARVPIAQEKEELVTR